jgi:hypothetical protein
MSSDDAIAVPGGGAINCSEVERIVRQAVLARAGTVGGALRIL